MNYEGKLFTVLGSHGFIGSSLVAEIKKRGGEVTTTPTKDSAAVFHFASYTHIPFEKNPAYHTHEIISSFLYFFQFCQENKIPFIYSSSALVYESPRPFYYLKKMTEDMQFIYDVKSVALRIFPVYGVGEGERGHPTAISQWIKEMIQGRRPIVFGDGTQSRDFVYISDVVDTILDSVEKDTRIKDVGAGILTDFNSIIHIINEELNTNLEPMYQPLPLGYTKGILCEHPIIPKVSIRDGIKKMIDEIKYGNI